MFAALHSKYEEPPKPDAVFLGGWGDYFVGAMACERNPGGSHLKQLGER